MLEDDDDETDDEYGSEEEEGENNMDGTVEKLSVKELLRQQRIDLAKFKIKLAKQGLRIKEVEGDGNCFFRAVADQLYGFEYYHLRLRKQVCDHLRENKEEYRYFIDNDIPIEKYIRLMSKDGAWGG